MIVEKSRFPVQLTQLATYECTLEEFKSWNPESRMKKMSLYFRLL
jgi:hypothetical protein